MDSTQPTSPLAQPQPQSPPPPVSPPHIPRSVSDAQSYECPVCKGVLVDPITIECGHTCCRTCLVDWLHNTQQPSCPAGCLSAIPRKLPGINILLKNRLEAKFPEIIASRREELKDGIAMYNSINAGDNIEYQPQVAGAAGNDININGDGNNNVVANIANEANKVAHVALRTCAHLAITVVVLYLVNRYRDEQSGTSAVEMHDFEHNFEHAHGWNPEDVAKWLTHENFTDFVQPFLQQAIDGATLLRLKEPDLLEFNITSHVRQLKLVVAIEKLVQASGNRPHDFWSFRAQHRFKTQLLTTALSSLPRLSAMYLYWFEPATFVAAVGTTASSPLLLWSMIFAAPQVVQMWAIAPLARPNPYITYAFASNFLVELQNWVLVICKREPINIKVKNFIGDTVKSMLWFGFVAVVFPITPWLLCDLLLYGSLLLTLTVPILSLLAAIILRYFSAQINRNVNVDINVNAAVNLGNNQGHAGADQRAQNAQDELDLLNELKEVNLQDLRHQQQEQQEQQDADIVPEVAEQKGHDNASPADIITAESPSQQEARAREQESEQQALRLRQRLAESSTASDGGPSKASETPDSQSEQQQQHPHHE